MTNPHGRKILAAAAVAALMSVGVGTVVPGTAAAAERLVSPLPTPWFNPCGTPGGYQAPSAVCHQEAPKDLRDCVAQGGAWGALGAATGGRGGDPRGVAVGGVGGAVVGCGMAIYGNHSK